MTLTLTNPILASDLGDDWYERVQEAIRLRSPRMRQNPQQTTIDIWSDGRGCWMPLMLPGNTVYFATYDDRNLVYRRLMAR